MPLISVNYESVSFGFLGLCLNLTFILKISKVFAKFLVERRTGSGRISVAGGNGFAGGGGGRVSINVFSRHDVLQFFTHGKSKILYYDKKIQV